MRFASPRGRRRRRLIRVPSTSCERTGRNRASCPRAHPDIFPPHRPDDICCASPPPPSGPFMTDSDLRPPRRLGPKPFTAHPRRWWDALAGSGFLIVLAATAGLAIGVPAGMRDYTPSPAKIRADKEQLDP